MITRSLADLHHWPRAVALALGFVAISATFVAHEVPTWVWIGATLHALPWPHVAWWWARRAPDSNAAERRNLILDHAAAGLWAAALSFNALPTVVMLTLIGMDSAYAGGRRLLRRGLATSAAGAAVGMLLLGADWRQDVSLPQVLACLPVLIVHPLGIGLLAGGLLHRLRRQSELLAEMSVRDPLSGLYNRRYLDERIAEALASRLRGGPVASLVLADFDHFKAVNDTLGHPAGDEAIRRFALLLQATLRTGDIAARYGGEEFAVLLPGASAAEAAALMRRLRTRMAETPLLDARPLTISAGIAELTADTDCPDAWLRVADQMLYRAKDLGRDRVVVAGESEPVAGDAPASPAAPPQRPSRPATTAAAAVRVSTPSLT